MPASPPPAGPPLAPAGSCVPSRSIDAGGCVGASPRAPIRGQGVSHTAPRAVTASGGSGLGNNPTIRRLPREETGARNGSSDTPLPMHERPTLRGKPRQWSMVKTPPPGSLASNRGCAMPVFDSNVPACTARRRSASPPHCTRMKRSGALVGIPVSPHPAPLTCADAPI